MSGLARNQKKVYDHLLKANQPLGAYDLLDGLRHEGFRAPPQIYRALKALTSMGLVHRVESLNAFIACGQKHSAGQIVFAICDECGTVDELTPVEIPEKIKQLSLQSGFNAKKMVVELAGTCSNCMLT